MPDFLYDSSIPLDTFAASCLERFGEQGYVWIRQTDEASDFFDRLIAQLSTESYSYQGVHQHRDAAGATGMFIQMGNGQRYPIPLHGELYYESNPPEALWFYCESSVGCAGHTTVCDGVSLFESLPVNWQNKLKATKLRYKRLESGETLAVSPLVVQPSGAIGFVNSLLLAYEVSRLKGRFPPGMEPLEVTWANGEAIEREFVRIVKKMAAPITLDIEWQQGDVLWVDNRRMLHGRRSGGSPERRIVTTLANIRVPSQVE